MPQSYFNPSSLAPQIQPSGLPGALQGAWEVDRNDMFKKAMGLQELMMQQELAQQRAQHERYTQSTPYELMQTRTKGLRAEAEIPHLGELVSGDVGVSN